MRNVMGMRDAGDIRETPGTSVPLIVPISCPVPERSAGEPSRFGKLEMGEHRYPATLVGTMKIKVRPGSLAFRLYQQEEITELVHCNSGLNPEYHDTIDAAGLRIVGLGEDGQARIVELPDHRFFLATLYLPQLSSTAERPATLVTAFLQAVASFKESTQAAAQGRRSRAVGTTRPRQRLSWE